MATEVVIYVMPHDVLWSEHPRKRSSSANLSAIGPAARGAMFSQDRSGHLDVMRLCWTKQTCRQLDEAGTKRSELEE